MPPFLPVASRDDVRADGLSAALVGVEKPLIFKDLVVDWPAVKMPSASALIDYLKACDSGKPCQTFRQARGDGKFFYDEDESGFNFQRAHVPLGMTLERLRGLMGKGEGEHIYIQSAPLTDFMPRLKAENALPGIEAEPRIWIGNRSLTQTHFDLYENLVCVVAGQKRFVLFPPDQTKNLYMGPIEVTVSGVPTSMADLENPDFETHPRFAEALATATVAELEPGDVLYIPYMWWHHVSSDAELNVQVNYWWNPAESLGQPMQVLIHALLGLRDLPSAQNAAWKAMFDHFVFHQGGDAAAHIKPELRGLLGEISPEQRAAIRKVLGQNLMD